VDPCVRKHESLAELEAEARHMADGATVAAIAALKTEGRTILRGVRQRGRLTIIDHGYGRRAPEVFVERRGTSGPLARRRGAGRPGRTPCARTPAASRDGPGGDPDEGEPARGRQADDVDRPVEVLR
jgi:hypothetical protein